MHGAARRIPLGGVLVQVMMLACVLPGLGVLIGRCTLDRTTGWRVEQMQARIQAVDELVNQGRARTLDRVGDDYAERVYLVGGRRVAKDHYARESAADLWPRRYHLVSREFYGPGGVIARDLLPRGASIDKRREYYASDRSVFLWDEFGSAGIPLRKQDRWAGLRRNGTRSPLPPPSMLSVLFYR